MAKKLAKALFGREVTKYVPGAAASDTLASPNDARFSYPYAETNDYAAKRKMLELTYGDERIEPERRTQTPEEVEGYKKYLNRLGYQKKGGDVKKTMPITALDQVDRMEKAKLLKNKK